MTLQTLPLLNGETVAFITLYGTNRHPEVTAWHRRVMVDHWRLPVNYIQCPFPRVSHGQMMNEVIAQTIDTPNAPDYYFWLDNDAIALKRCAVDMAIDAVKNKMTVWGHAWQSNHKQGPTGQIAHPYASQAALCYARELYNVLGRPDCDHFNPRSDTAEEITYLAKQKGYTISLVYPSHSMVLDTPLDNGMQQGIGNTYGPDLWYHASRMTDQRSAGWFIEKCQEVLYGRFT